MSARTPEAEPLLTPAEVATMFRVDPKTVTRWAKAGKLTSIRTLGGHRRYRETEVRALLAGIPQHPGVAAPGRADAQCSTFSQRPMFMQLGGSTPAASTPHRGARFAFDAMTASVSGSRGRSGLLDAVTRSTIRTRFAAGNG
jgi:excisionase family DNA binding protein